MKFKNLIFTALAICAVVFSCKYALDHGFRQTYQDANAALHSPLEADFYKIHLKNGNVAILQEVSSIEGDSLEGRGQLYDFNRNEIERGTLSFQVGEVAIIETNDLESIRSKDNQRFAGLAFLTAANLVVSAICLSNPKACFGSCPTFYTEGHDDLHSSSAEGFSASISPSLMATDVDALQLSAPAGPLFIKMKNEALETHAVDKLEILAVPKKENQIVFHSNDGRFYRCGKAAFLRKASTNSNEILTDILKEKDDLEYFSKTDSNSLFEKEELILEFDNLDAKNIGLVINFRQTLLTTFLLYNGISYCGDEVGDYLAKIETTPFIQKNFKTPFARLGGIEVYFQTENSNKWHRACEVFETGPIAKNLQMLPLENFSPKGKTVKLKLVTTKGMWRLDYAALVSILEEVQPLVLPPAVVEILSGMSQKVESVQQEDGEHFVTFRGDEAKFQFELPENEAGNDYELFLSSTGYYIEWMRQDWLEDKDTEKLQKMLFYNDAVWRDLAREYKTVEAEMDEAFWNSKFTDVN